MIVPIRICSLSMSVTLEDPGTRSRAWLVALLRSCGGIWLRTTRRRACTEVGPWHLTVSSSKRLRWMRNISACATVLFVCGHGAGNLCTVSIAVSLHEQSPVDTKETFGWLKAANLPGAIEGLVVAAQDQALRTRYYEYHILHRDVSPRGGSRGG